MGKCTNLINAWDEILEIIDKHDHEIKCATLKVGIHTLNLPLNHSQIEYGEFIAKVKCVNYNNESNGTMFINGTIWLTDDSWLSRIYVDWTEQWKLYRIPEIPNILYKRDYDTD